MLNSLVSSVLSDVFRFRLPLWSRVLATALLLSLLSAAFAPKLLRLPALTSIAVMIISVSPLTYARARAFADDSTPGRALFDAAGSGVGLVAAMLAIASVREALGSGTLGALSLFSSPPIPMLGQAFGGFLITAAAMAAFRMASARQAA
jgi:electron transport complex protein RnfE